jgi:pimeloyl-ACP methyl ester carboxylesterase
VFRQLGSGVRVIRLDLPDDGLSSPVPSRRSTTEDDLSRSDRLVEALGVRRFLIGGASFGGIVAHTYAGLHPEKIEGLVLVSRPVRPIPTWLCCPATARLKNGWISTYSVATWSPAT